MRARILAACLLLAGAPGCMSGLIYTHVTVPLDVNLDRTPASSKEARDSANTFQYYVLRVDWGSDGIGDVARRYGFTRIDYADLETLSVLGVWRQKWAHVYGKRPSQD